MGTHFKLLKKVLNFSSEQYLKVAGDLFIYDGEYETALAMVDKALTHDASDTRALVLKGDILFCLNRDVEALQQFNKVIKLDPACAEAYVSKAGVLDGLGHYVQALACCNQAFQLSGPHNAYLLPSLFDQKINLLMRLKRYRQARRLLKEAATRLMSEDYQYLCSCYTPLLDAPCRSRQAVLDQARKLSLRVVNGSLSKL